MVLTLKKIQHRSADQIGIFFPYSAGANQKLKSIGAVYSSTLHCWYMGYSAANYQLLQKNFEQIIIENPKPENAKTAPVAGSESRDLPPIVTSSDNPKLNPTCAKKASLKKCSFFILLIISILRNLVKIFLHSMICNSLIIND